MSPDFEPPYSSASRIVPGIAAPHTYAVRFLWVTTWPTVIGLFVEWLLPVFGSCAYTPPYRPPKYHGVQMLPRTSDGGPRSTEPKPESSSWFTCQRTVPAAI